MINRGLIKFCIYTYKKNMYIGYGEKPEKQIKKFMNMKNQYRKLGLKYKYLENKVKHQKVIANVECIVYLQIIKF